MVRYSDCTLSCFRLPKLRWLGLRPAPRKKPALLRATSWPFAAKTVGAIVTICNSMVAVTPLTVLFLYQAASFGIRRGHKESSFGQYRNEFGGGADIVPQAGHRIRRSWLSLLHIPIGPRWSSCVATVSMHRCSGCSSGRCCSSSTKSRGDHRPQLTSQPPDSPRGSHDKQSQHDQHRAANAKGVLGLHPH